jgi:hypothetical protein
LVTRQPYTSNSTGEARISIRCYLRLPSNDGIRSNTSQYVYIYIYIYMYIYCVYEFVLKCSDVCV